MAFRGLDIPLTFVCDIGCGTGTWLLAARNEGIRGVGYDVNHVATDYGREVHGLDLRREFWDPSLALPERPSLYSSIMVCEHLDQPRPMLRALCEAAKRDGAALFISVPIFGEDCWKYMLDPNPETLGTVFFDNDVHVTHFSALGMELCLREFGATKIDWLHGGVWYGAVARFQS
jgi:SAM-dependent methyltransferase